MISDLPDLPDLDAEIREIPDAPISYDEALNEEDNPELAV